MNVGYYFKSYCDNKSFVAILGKLDDKYWKIIFKLKE